MDFIVIIVLLIIIIYLYNQTLIETKRKENYQSQCTRNCGNYNIDRTSTNISGCLSCGYCGVCTLPNKSQICMNGDEDGSYFNNDCSGSNWKFGSGIISPTGLNLNYESQLQSLGQSSNLPSQTTDISYEIPKETINTDKTIQALADLLDKIDSTKENNNIDDDTISQLQQILNQLQS